MEIAFSINELLLVSLIVTIGSLLQGSIGFGLGPVAVPILVLIDPIFIPGPLLLTALVLNLLVSYREHQSIELKSISWAIFGRVVGTVVGAMILLVVPKKDISIVFGSMVLIAVLISISGVRLSLNRKNLFSAGTMSGIMGTTSSIGGAPMALVYQHLKGPSIRATLSSIFTIGTILSVVSLIIISKFGYPELKATAIIIPGTVLGFYLSNYTKSLLDKGLIRHSILIVSAVTGAIVIIKNIIN